MRAGCGLLVSISDGAKPGSILSFQPSETAAPQCALLPVFPVEGIREQTRMLAIALQGQHAAARRSRHQARRNARRTLQPTRDQVIGADWRLPHRRYPVITPTALIGTLRLARCLKLGTKNSLTALTTQLTPQIERLATGSQPHRALWDTIAAALLLPALIKRAWPDGASLADLLDIAAIDPATPAKAAKPAAQDSLSTQLAETLRVAPVEQLRQQGAIRSDRVADAFRVVSQHVFMAREPLERAYANDSVSLKRDE